MKKKAKKAKAPPADLMTLVEAYFAGKRVQKGLTSTKRGKA